MKLQILIFALLTNHVLAATTVPIPAPTLSPPRNCRVVLYCHGSINTLYNYSWYDHDPQERTFAAISLPIDMNKPMPTMLDLWRANKVAISALEQKCNKIRYAQTTLSPFDPTGHYYDANGNYTPTIDPWRQDLRLMWMVPILSCSTGPNPNVPVYYEPPRTD